MMIHRATLLSIIILAAMVNAPVFADAVSADFNGDNKVDLLDFAEIAFAWQAIPGQPNFDEIYDLDNDYDIDTADLYSFVLGWLSAPPTPSYLPLRTAREKVNFNAGWKFYKGAIASDAAQSPAYSDSSWLAVNLPHNPPMGSTAYDTLRPAWSTGYSYEGVSWYRKHFYLDDSMSGKKIFIEFEAANTVTDVWINGTHLTTHYGGYLPFMFDVTAYVNYGTTENVIAAKVDNTDNPDVPIGKSDWFNWGGIYRDVWLHTTGNLHVTDAVYANTVAGGGIFVTYPSVNTSSAQVQVKTQVKNETAAAKTCTLKSFIVDTNNIIVAQMTGTQSVAASGVYTFTQTTTITNPHLWHPNTPYLYTLYTEIYDGTAPVDIQQTRIGIRSFSFSKANGFKINGQTFRFRGTNRLQDYPWWGYAMGNVNQRRDAVKLKEAGFDYIRTSHYPQDPAFMDACDELGILVMDAIPGFQYIGGTTFKNHSYQNMRDMIRRDRNHPCVIAWELSLNEMWWTDTDYSPTAVSIGHAEYPGSSISAWKDDTIYDIFIATPTAGARTYTGSKPLIISEYGHWEYGGDACDSDVHRGNVDWYNYGESDMNLQVANHLDGYNQNLGMSNMCGDGLWVGIDYGPYPSGVLDIYRLPKFSYYFWKSQRDPAISIPGISCGPMAFIANYWTSSSPATVKVFSNCQQVKLYKNNVLYATQTPDTGTNVPHPPFTFTGLTYASGQLKAEGLIDGRVVATHIVRTPGTASSLSVAFDTTDVQANGSETIFVYASILDSNGTLIPSASSTYVTFSVTGPAALACPATVKSEAGIATGMIRVTNTPGLITVTATASGLTSGNASFATYSAGSP
jgi:beta-galactosidase